MSESRPSSCLCPLNYDVKEKIFPFGMGLFKKLQSGSQPSFKFQTKRFSFGTILWTYRLCFLYSCRILSSPFENVFSAVFYAFQSNVSKKVWTRPREVVPYYRKPVPSTKSMSGRAQVSLTSYYLFDSLNKYWISAERWYGSYTESYTIKLTDLSYVIHCCAKISPSG